MFFILSSHNNNNNNNNINIIIIIIIIILKDGQISLLVIDNTVSNVPTPDVKYKRGKSSTGVKAQSREVSKSTKYRDQCNAVDALFIPIASESQGLAGQQFLQYFD